MTGGPERLNMSGGRREERGAALFGRWRGPGQMARGSGIELVFNSAHSVLSEMIILGFIYALKRYNVAPAAP